MERRKSRGVKVGDLIIGAGSPIWVQSMTKTDSHDVGATVKQIHQLAEAGCEIVRVALPDMAAAQKIGEIKRQIHIPLVGDIHFDYRIALEAIKQGVDKIRINPGNIRGKERVKAIVKAAKDEGIAIRVGVNAGSLTKELLEKYEGPTARALVESALSSVKLMEDLGFFDIVISVKAFDVPITLDADRQIAGKVAYPLHLGITEAGLPPWGSIRSAVGIGALLAEGIGDTLRVSLTGEPTEEVRVGYEILKALNLREKGPTIISCPTCGRCEIDLVRIAQEVEQRVNSQFSNFESKLKVAIMGCVVNGPGEAQQADVGLAGGKGVGVIFRKGKVVRKVKEAELVEALLQEVNKLAR